MTTHCQRHRHSQNYEDASCVVETHHIGTGEILTSGWDNAQSGGEESRWVEVADPCISNQNATSNFLWDLRTH